MSTLYMISMISSGAVLSAEIVECTVSQAYCCVLNNEQDGLYPRHISFS